MNIGRTIMRTNTVLLRAVAIVLSLALVMSGMAHASGSHAGEHLGASLAVIASHGAAPADTPCDDSSHHGVSDACSHAAGCAFGVSVQAGISYEPLEHRETVQTITEVQHGIPAAPPVRPPRPSVQA
jgi:hypothetical protein